jgi:hypothetical protein
MTFVAGEDAEMRLYAHYRGMPLRHWAGGSKSLRSDSGFYYPRRDVIKRSHSDNP